MSDNRLFHQCNAVPYEYHSIITPVVRFVKCSKFIFSTTTRPKQLLQHKLCTPAQYSHTKAMQWIPLQSSPPRHSDFLLLAWLAQSISLYDPDDESCNTNASNFVPTLPRLPFPPLERMWHHQFWGGILHPRFWTMRHWLLWYWAESIHLEGGRILWGLLLQQFWTVTMCNMCSTDRRGRKNFETKKKNLFCHLW